METPSGQRLLTIPPGATLAPVAATQVAPPATAGRQGGPRQPLATVGPVTAFAINPGVDHRDTIGKVAPGLFAQEGRCWRMVYENAAGHETHCPEPSRGSAGGSS